jgi:competence protein ComEA
MPHDLKFESRAEVHSASGGDPMRVPARGRLRAVWQALAGPVWAPLAGKVGLVLLALLVFAGIGRWSLLEEGQAVVERRAPPEASASWLASPAMESEPSVEPGSAHEVAHVHAQAGTKAAPSPSPCVPAAEGAAEAQPANPPGTARTADGKVVLNLAGVSDLTTLPGVGPKRAEAILELRARLGRFKKVNELLRVRGIGVKSLKKIAPLVVVDVPES